MAAGWRLNCSSGAASLIQQQARAFLFPDQYQPSPPTDFPGMDAAADRILQAVHEGEEICVWGDFDVDGQTSTTILVSALRNLNAQVRHYIPLRETESHGVHLDSLKRLAEEGIKLLVTCDTGISAVAETAWAKAHGVDVVITDHHELPDILPDADAIVNPRLLPPDHPLYPLPGCGVAYKLAEELLTRSGMGMFRALLLVEERTPEVRLGAGSDDRLCGRRRSPGRPRSGDPAGRPVSVGPVLPLHRGSRCRPRRRGAVRKRDSACRR